MVGTNNIGFGFLEQQGEDQKTPEKQGSENEEKLDLNSGVDEEEGQSSSNQINKDSDDVEMANEKNSEEQEEENSQEEEKDEDAEAVDALLDISMGKAS